MDKFDFGIENTYRLIDVQDHQGRSKVESRDLYKERVGCIAKNIHMQEICLEDTSGQVIRMDFVVDGHNRWINKKLRTSPLVAVEKKGEQIKIKTVNSIYVLEPAMLPKQKYQDAADLIELFLSDEGDRFVKGVYYDVEKVAHELQASIHVGMIVDSCLVYLAEDDISSIVCRYFIQPDTIEFYDTIYHQQEYKTPILIHNCSNEVMTIQMPFSAETWKINPWGETRINPPIA